MNTPERQQQELDAIDMMTDEQRDLSRRREEAYERSKLGKWKKDNGSLLFDIDNDLIDSKAIEELGAQYGVVRKPEFHATIFGYKAGAEILRAIRSKPKSERNEIWNKLNAAVSALNDGWNADYPILLVTKKYPPEKGTPEKPGEQRTSLIQMIDFPRLNDVYGQVNELLGLHLEQPPTHITIMTGSTNPEHMTEGIGLPTREMLESLHPTQVWPAPGKVVDEMK